MEKYMFTIGQSIELQSGETVVVEKVDEQNSILEVKDKNNTSKKVKLKDVKSNNYLKS